MANTPVKKVTPSQNLKVSDGSNGHMILDFDSLKEHILVEESSSKKSWLYVNSGKIIVVNPEGRKLTISLNVYEVK